MNEEADETHGNEKVVYVRRAKNTVYRISMLTDEIEIGIAFFFSSSIEIRNFR